MTAPLTLADLAAQLDDALARQIMRDHANHVGFDGEPVIDAAEAADAVELLRLGREVRHA